MVVCLSRDVPGTAKRTIVQQLESDLPGLTIHVDDEKNMGLHVGSLQQALSQRYVRMRILDQSDMHTFIFSHLHRFLIFKQSSS